MTNKYIKPDREYIEIYPVNWKKIEKNDVRNIFSGTSEEGLKEISLYIHIPFCPYICSFCKFNVTEYSPERYNAYIDSIKKELKFYENHPDFGNKKVTAVYFGGGTGSMIKPEDAEEILDIASSSFSLENPEITVECHPGTITEDKLQKYAKAGINRLSLGLQSFQQKNLKKIDRKHSAQHNVNILTEALESDFDSVVIDLMYRLPGQDKKNLKKDLEKIKKLSPDGVSAYSLEPEGTSLEEKIKKMPNDQLDREMFYMVGDFLENSGYVRFMQPDFAKPGKESKYVMSAWKAPQQLMIGLGAGAHSHHFGGYVWANVYSVDEYIRIIDEGCFPGVMGVQIPRRELKFKYMVLGVRGLKVRKDEYRGLFGEEISTDFEKEITNLKEKGWLKEKKEEYEVTREGLYYIDNISKEFYSPENKGEGQPWLKGLYDYIPEETYKVDLA